VYLIVAALFIEIALMPINALNLVLLILMSAIVLQYFALNDRHQLNKALRPTLVVHKWTSALFIFMKFIF
jgi:uncharacterized membrane protein YqjE